MEENKFKIVDKKGKEVEFEVLFTFESDETKKNYMVYTDNTKDADGKTRVYASDRTGSFLHLPKTSQGLLSGPGISASCIRLKEM